jgi:hypothetical protein
MPLYPTLEEHSVLKRRLNLYCLYLAIGQFKKLTYWQYQRGLRGISAAPGFGAVGADRRCLAISMQAAASHCRIAGNLGLINQQHGNAVAYGIDPATAGAFERAFIRRKGERLAALRHRTDQRIQQFLQHHRSILKKFWPSDPENTLSIGLCNESRFQVHVSPLYV